MFEWNVIVQEAGNGNYSFFILAAAILQLIVMILVGLKK